MKIDEAMKHFPDEWIAFEITKSGENPEGVVKLHSSDPEEFDQELLEREKEFGKEVYITFTGDLTPEEGVLIL